MVNSGGGSPVYSQLMTYKVLEFAKSKSLPFFTFSEDVAASGGYFILCAGDTVYASAHSLVGSIGVISMNAATKDWLKLNKIERTHISTSPNLLESKYDPMLHSEVSESMMEETRERQDEIFREFKKHVLKFREGKFKPDAEAQIFTADVVTGQKALEFGLIDSLGLCDQVVRDKYGPKTVLVDFSKKSKMEEFSSRFQLKAQSLL